MFYLKKDFNYLELATPKKEKKKKRNKRLLIIFADS